MRPLLLALLLPFAVTGADDLRGHELPKDPTAAVLVLDYEGGYGLARKSDDPFLLVRADGTIVVGALYAGEKRVEAKLDPRALQSLLRFVLDEQGLAAFDQKKMEAAVKAAGGDAGPAVIDAGSTIVRVNADGREIRASCYALGYQAGRFPDVATLAQLDAVAKRLERLRHETCAGGREEIAKRVEAVNAALAKAHPGVPPLATDDLRGARREEDGRRSLVFTRSDARPDGAARHTSARVDIAPDGSAKIAVRVD